MRLYCATTNKGKLREFHQAIEAFGEGRFTLETVPGLSTLPPSPEDGGTFEENAMQKALYYGKHAPGYLFADDSGLAVRALRGAPGVHSARYAGPDATDGDNNRLLLEQLRNEPDRTAEFVCVIAVVRNGEVVHTFRGSVEGRIIDVAEGLNGFGYDPLFYHEPFGCTFGVATGEQKLSVSHRGRAMAQMVEFLKRQRD